MQPTASQNDLHQDCLANLNLFLELAMQIAETAGVEGNHKVVLQAIREGTRLITLILKMTRPPDQGRSSKSKQAPSLVPPPKTVLKTLNSKITTSSSGGTKSGKFQEKTPLSKKVALLNQEDKLFLKKAGENSASGSPGAPPVSPATPTVSANLPVAATPETDNRKPKTGSQRQLPKKKRLLKKYYREQQKGGQLGQCPAG